MNNPFEIQMNRLRTNNNNEISKDIDIDTNVNTQVSSPLFDRRKKDNKQIFSVKLQKELSDKLITLSVEQNLSFTDIIEYGLEKVFAELDVKINHEVVRRYNETRGKKK